MRLPQTLLAALAIAAFAMPAQAQNVAFTDQSLDQFAKGLAAEKAELDKVEDQLKQLDARIASFRECAGMLSEAGGGKTGLAAKIAMKAKCGATSEDGFLKQRAKLLEQPEKIGAQTAGMKVSAYAQMKERVTGYLRGDRGFSDSEQKALAARANEFSQLMGVSVAKASEDNGAGGRRRGAGGVADRMIGNAVAGQMQMYSTQMMWAYVNYLWSLMYMSGATMFETPYQPGQWTQWTIADASKPDEKMTLERAFLRREADGSEWWRIKTIGGDKEQTDTITLESLFKKTDPSGTTMQVVRMRGKFPGDSAGKEMMVPENMAMVSMSAFPMKPTKESLAGATLGTESVKVGARSYTAKHVKYSAGTGDMEWWLADSAPGTVVRVQFSGQGQDQKWTMDMTGSGTGAKSELGVQ